MIFSTYINPVADPVSLAEMKLHLKIESAVTADDELIKTQIRAAVDWCEKYEGQSYMMRQYKLYLDYLPSEILLPYSPVVSVSSITYIDDNGATQTLSSSYYTVDTDSLPARIYPAYNQTYPSTRGVEKAVCVTYTAGYATTFTVNATTNVFTIGNAVFADTNLVRVSNDIADLPAPLAVDTNYYVRDISGSTLKLAETSGGTAIDLTDTGTGVNNIYFAARGDIPSRVKSAIKLIVGHFYENREQVSDLSLSQIPFSVKNLLFERIR